MSGHMPLCLELERSCNIIDSKTIYTSKILLGSIQNILIERHFSSSIYVDCRMVHESRRVSSSPVKPFLGARVQSVQEDSILRLRG